MPVATMAVGAVAVASAVLMILELSNPYSGVFGLARAARTGAGHHGQGVTRRFLKSASRLTPPPGGRNQNEGDGHGVIAVNSRPSCWGPPRA